MKTRLFAPTSGVVMPWRNGSRESCAVASGRHSVLWGRCAAACGALACTTATPAEAPLYELTFGDRSSYCTEAVHGERDVVVGQYAWNVALEFCMRAAHDHGYRFVEYRPQSGYCVLLATCPRERRCDLGRPCGENRQDRGQRVYTVTPVEQRADRQDLCRCLNWKMAYDQKVECGEFAELSSFTRHYGMSLGQLWLYKTDHPVHYTETCMLFFEKLNHNMCVNLDMLDYNKGAWCYVDARCTKLRGGSKLQNQVSIWETPVRRDVSWKFCDSAQDYLLRDIDPNSMFHLSRLSQVPFALHALFGYRAFRPAKNQTLIDVLWGKIRFDWEAGDDRRLPNKLQVAVERLWPLIIFTDDTNNAVKTLHSQYMLVWGRDLYSIGKRYSTVPLSFHEWMQAASFFFIISYTSCQTRFRLSRSMVLFRSRR